MLVASAFLMFGISSAFAQNTDNAKVEKIFAQLEDDWAVANVHADQIALDRILAPEWTYTDIDGNVVSKAQMYAEMKAGVGKVTSVTNDEVKVRVFGDTAIVSGLETEKSNYKGKDTSGQYRYTDVFIKRNGTWWAVATHSSKVAK